LIKKKNNVKINIVVVVGARCVSMVFVFATEPREKEVEECKKNLVAGLKI